MKTLLSDLLKEKQPGALCSVPPTVTVAEAVAQMNARKIGCILVLADGRIAGIFTERDVLTRVVAAGIDPRTTPLSAVMTTDPKVLPPETPLEEAMTFIMEKRVRHLPVVQDGRVLGLVSMGDINKWLVQHLQFEAETLRNYVSGGYAG